jgi:hypothetical protein
MVRFEQRNTRNVPIPPLFEKTKLCKFYRIGMCTRGDNCTFAHASDELQPLPNLYKTKMCFELTKNKRCKNPNCPYAHNKCELRPVEYENPKSEDLLDQGQDDFSNAGFYAGMPGIMYAAVCTDSWAVGASPQSSFEQAKMLADCPYPSKEATWMKPTWSRQTASTTSAGNSTEHSAEGSSEESDCSESDAYQSPPSLKWTVKNTFLELSADADVVEDTPLTASRMFRNSSSPVFL